MVNVSELLINLVIRMYAKAAVRHQPKGMRLVIPLDCRDASSITPPVERQDLSQSCDMPGTW